MKLSKLTFVVLVFLFSFANCSDSMLISQKINQLKAEGKIKSVILNLGEAPSEKIDIALLDLKIENGLLVVDEQYYNLGLVKWMELEGDVVELVF